MTDFSGCMHEQDNKIVWIGASANASKSAWFELEYRTAPLTTAVNLCQVSAMHCQQPAVVEL